MKTDRLELEIVALKKQLSTALERIQTLEEKSRLGSVDNNEFERFYLAFENKYRGSKGSVRQKCQDYLAIYKELLPNPQSAILDLGCGRGEWLTLLQENGFSNTLGIDFNTAMVKECKTQGLSCHNIDIFEFVKDAKDSSFAAISGMHVIEHIPFRKLAHLFKNVFRALEPGGIALFETPNPRNLFVGAFSFHFDPTHVKPVPVELSSFLAEHTGFNIHSIRYSNAHPDMTEGTLENFKLPQVVHDSFASGLDYGIILQRPFE